jgi:hypothetical protein
VLRDPEFAYKTAALRARLTQEPGRPLVVVLGSSRAAMGFRPDALALCRTPDGQPPVVFNYAFTGAGPVLELVCLQRLLRAGVRPDWLIVEVHPALLHRDAAFSEEFWTNAARLGWKDLRLLRRYSDRPRAQLWNWLESRLVPAAVQRFAILSRLAPNWLPWGDQRQDCWLQMDRSGWLPYGKQAVNEAEYRKGVAFALHQYHDCFPNYRVGPSSDRALRELLGRCQREGIGVLLLTMPEGEEFQGWFPPRAKEEIRGYLTGLSRDYGVRWVDARDWVGRECFFDGHHLLPDGAAVFTARFGRDVLSGLLEGPSPAPRRTATGAHAGTPRGSL